LSTWRSPERGDEIQKCVAQSVAMTVTVGTRLGPYEIIAPIGSGGMGEVFRAHDARLGREVAVKALRPDALGDRERVFRFAREARLVGGLNHPNVLAVFDVGEHAGSPYLVTELLEGDTLRSQMQGGPLPPRKALGFAIQIAHGLAAAHEKGVIHRDLKPENLFVTVDERLKILDFGLAKREAITPASDDGEEDTVPGVLIGTVHYMSPEQVAGDLVDHRSDLFAFGIVLFEMLAGERPFSGQFGVDVLQSILRATPPKLPERSTPWPPGLQDVILHCLEKRPEQRFQSARDLAFQLELILGAMTSGTSSPGRPAVQAVEPPKAGPRRRGVVLAGLGLGVLALGGGAAAVVSRVSRRDPPTYQRITFGRGTVHSARFASDGRTLVYSAAWEGAPSELFLLRPGASEARPLGLPRAHLVSLSRSDDIALLNAPTDLTAFSHIGTLARVPFSGGTPRPLATGVVEADWTPSGELAVVRQVGGTVRLELPVGQVLYQTNGSISHARVSPKGDLIAFIDHPVMGDDAGEVAVVDLRGEKRVLTRSWLSAQGLAWNGREIWFTADPNGVSRSLWAVTLSGELRAVARAPGMFTLLDISAEGRVLFTRELLRSSVTVRAPGAEAEQDLSWLDFSTPSGLSRDGRKLSFFESGEGGGTRYATYVRATDGTPAIKLGEGALGAISPNGEWVATLPSIPEGKVLLLPTGPGEPRPLSLPLAGLQRVWWPKDGHLLLAGNEEGGPVRHFLYDLVAGSLRPVTPPGVVNRVAAQPQSPDGQLLVAQQLDGRYALFPVEGGGAPRLLPGLLEGEEPFAWTQDGEALLVLRRTQYPVKVHRVRITDGERSLWRELSPADRAGAKAIHYLGVAAGADAYVYSFVRHLSDLYLAEGLR
jgi:tRNA A-37 threonylcarbamoyl transferase component Bud32